MFFLISKIGGTVLPNMTAPVPGCLLPIDLEPKIALYSFGRSMAEKCRI